MSVGTGLMDVESYTPSVSHLPLYGQESNRVIEGESMWSRLGGFL